MRVLVLGAPCSGNRMLTRMLCEASGYANDLQAPVRHGVVIPRPVPAATLGPGNEANWAPLDNSPPWDQAVVIQRSWHCTIAAQVDQGHFRDEATAIASNRRALGLIFAYLASSGRPWSPVSYEALAEPAEVRELCDRLGLDATKVTTTWQDANAKWYGGTPWSDRRPLFPPSGPW